MKLKRAAFFVVLGVLLPTSFSEAAMLYIEPNTVELNRGDTVALAVRVNTDEDECVNVVDAVIHYPANIEPVDTSRGGSIMSLWAEEPVINKQNRTITFAAGIPNGYCGRIPGDPRLTNTVLELLFQSPGMPTDDNEGSETALINFGAETRVLLNDGAGTEAPLVTYGAEIKLTNKVGESIINEWSDRIAADDLPPEEFTIELVRTPNAFSNKYYITFNTSDKQSGIDHYEVIEEPLEESWLFRWGAADAPWRTTRSPYVLRDQSLNSTIRVKAVDKAGNEYIAHLVPDESQRTLSTQGKIMVALIGVLLIFFVAAAVVAYLVHRRKKSSLLPTDEVV